MYVENTCTLIYKNSHMIKGPPRKIMRLAQPETPKKVGGKRIEKIIFFSCC